MPHTSTGYSRLQITLHWLIAILIAIAWFTHDNMGRALRQRIEKDLSGMDGATPHTIAGILVLMLVVWRMIVRWRNGAPEAEGSAKVVRAAIWGHRVLYVLMFVVPLLGATAWMGKIRTVGEVHEVLAQGLMIVVIGHIVMALWHGLIKKDGTLRRMNFRS